MTRSILALLLLACILASGCSRTESGRQPDSQIATQSQPISPTLSEPIPSDKREELRLPALLGKAASEAGAFNGPVGYSLDTMANFGPGKTVISTVLNLFTDVRKVPDFSGLITDAAVASASDPYGLVRMCYAINDARAAGGMTPPAKDSWGWEPLENSLSSEQAMAKLLAAPDKGQLESFAKLPESVKRLTVRLIVADAVARNYMAEAFDADFLRRVFKTDDLASIPRQEILAFASAAVVADECPRTAFEAMDRVDMQFLAFASALYLVRFRGAVAEYREAVGDTPPSCSLEKPLVFQTVAGEVRICGPGDDANTSCGALVIDLGGNDSYTSPHELLNPFAAPFAAVVDLGGNDRYTDDNKQGSLACGVYGLSVLADLGGNDSYSCLEAGLGAAYFGTGVLIDYAGDDMYASSKGMTQGAAHFGAGVLSDLGGNDDYFCGYEGQGFGSTRGVGLLVDVAGNDNYRVSDTAMMSAAFGDRPISFAQGAAFGRRSDFGDGHSLAGGIGILAEGAGNDHYHGAIYCQGTAYWWGLGICEDKAGDDSYRCLWYSLGSAPHFAIGCMVDVKGNDRYNADAKDAVTQYQGCARDGSIGVFVDGDGDDHYFLRNRCAGAADLNSIAVFWDRYGNDIYETDLSSPYQADPPLGASATYPRMRSFRDYMVTFGFFADTLGTDAYMVDPRDHEGGRKPLCAQNSSWVHHRQYPFLGYGYDGEYFVKAPEPAKEQE